MFWPFQWISEGGALKTWISGKKWSFSVRGLPVGAERATGYRFHAVFSRGSEFFIGFEIGHRDHAEIQDSNMGRPRFYWYLGPKLSLISCLNLVFRHVPDAQSQIRLKFRNRGKKLHGNDNRSLAQLQREVFSQKKIIFSTYVSFCYFSPDHLQKSTDLLSETQCSESGIQQPFPSVIPCKPNCAN